MNTAAYNLLSGHDLREVSLLAEPYDRFAGTRPAIVIPSAAEGAPDLPQERAYFQPGSRVRIVRPPHRSQIGTLIGLRKGVDILPNGILAATGEIRLQNGTRVVLPLANLEVLE
jgi:hypothetical protein